MFYDHNSCVFVFWVCWDWFHLISSFFAIIFLKVRDFTDKTLKRILREILYGMAHLQDHRMVHGDLRPELIGVPLKREDNFRLLDRLGNSARPLDVQKKNIETNKPLYIAPELFKHLLRDPDSKFKYNPFKADIFSLGLIILEAGVFSEISHIYEHESGEIFKEELIALVEQFIEKYPRDFILQETLMIMLEFSPKLRQEPTTLLKSIRKMDRVAREKGEFMVSQVNYHQDALVNQVEFTESGYRLKDSGKMQYSFYHRFEGNFSTDVVPTEDVESEMRTSLVKRIKDRGSQIGLKGKGKSMSKTFDRVTEDIDGEVSRENSKKVSLATREGRENKEVMRNTLEQMILENVGIDLSAQHDHQIRSKNQFSVNTLEEDNDYLKTEYSDSNPDDPMSKTKSQPAKMTINAKRDSSKFDEIIEENENLERRIEQVSVTDESQEPEVEEIQITYVNSEDVKFDKVETPETPATPGQSEELDSEIKELVNPDNYNYNPNIHVEAIAADYKMHGNPELVSSQEDARRADEVKQRVLQMGKLGSIQGKTGESEKPEIHGGSFQKKVKLLNMVNKVKKVNSMNTKVHEAKTKNADSGSKSSQNEPEETQKSGGTESGEMDFKYSTDKGGFLLINENDKVMRVSKKEVDEIIEDKINEIIQEELVFQNSQRNAEVVPVKVNKPSISKQEGKGEAVEKTENVFKMSDMNPNYPSKVFTEEVETIEMQNNQFQAEYNEGE